MLKVLKNKNSYLYKSMNTIGEAEKWEFSKFSKITILLTCLVFPICLSIMFFIFKEFKVIDTLIINKLNIYIVKTLIPIIGLSIILKKDWKMVFESKIYIYYLWIIIFPLFNTYFYESIVSFVPQNAKTVFYYIYSILFSFCIGAIFIFVIIYRNQCLYQMHQKNVKNKFLITISIIILGSIIFAIINWLFSLIQQQITTSISDNQQSVGVKVDNVYSIIKSILISIIIAPIIEELVFRYLWFNFYENKWHAILFTTIIFAFAHIQNTADWKHIISYLPLGIVNGTIFYLFKNVYPIIGIHMICNIFAFIYPFLFN